jgi:hypothetical protein
MALPPSNQSCDPWLMQTTLHGPIGSICLLVLWFLHWFWIARRVSESEPLTDQQRHAAAKKLTPSIGKNEPGPNCNPPACEMGGVRTFDSEKEQNGTSGTRAQIPGCGLTRKG